MDSDDFKTPQKPTANGHKKSDATPTKTLRSGTMRGAYLNDDEFKSKLEEYLALSGLPSSEQEAVRKLPLESLKKLILEWEISREVKIN